MPQCRIGRHLVRDPPKTKYQLINIELDFYTVVIFCTFSSKTRQDKTRQDKTRQDKTRQVKSSQVKTRQDKTRQDKTRQNKTRNNSPSSVGLFKNIARLKN
jgi:cation transport regulator ChaB